MKRLQTIITVIIIFIMIVVNFAILYLMIDIKLNLKDDIGTSVNKTIEKVDLPKVIKNEVKTDIDNLKIGAMIDESVNKKIESLNLRSGKDGINGKNGAKGDKGDTAVSVKTTIVEKTIEQVPVNGLTPVMQCNSTKNRWESTYDGGKSFDIVFNELGKIAKCNP